MKRKTEKKGPTTLNNPHDAFFKIAFSRKDVAQECLERFLPKKLAEGLDYSTMVNIPNAYVDERLKQFYSDVAWTVKFKGMDIVPIFLFEHKSYPDEGVLFQILRYMLCVWEQDRAENDKTPRLVIPIIIYHGEKEWKVKPLVGHFGEIDEDLEKYVPKFDFVFKNLTTMAEAELREMTDGHVYAAMATLSRGHKANFVEKYFVDILGRFPTNEEAADERNFLIALIVYILALPSQKNEQISIAMKSVPSHLKSTVMTTYDILIEKGWHQGIEEGVKKGIEEGVKKGIEEGVKKGIKEGVKKGIKEGLTLGALQKSKKVVAQLLKEFPQFSDERIAGLADVKPNFVEKMRVELAKKGANK